MNFKNITIVIFFSLIFSCKTVLPMEKVTEEKDEKVLENLINAKISMLNQVSTMIEGKSPEKKAIQLPEPWKITSPKTFCKDLGKGVEILLHFELTKKGISKKDFERETAKFDKYYESILPADMKKFKPASKAFREKILKQAKDRGIPDISVVKGSEFATANPYYVEVNEKRLGQYPLNAQAAVIEHELTHALNNDVSKIQAIEELLKSKSSNGQLTPKSKKMLLNFERHIEVNADLVGASQNEFTMDGYERLMEEFIKEDGPGPIEGDEHPAHIHRHQSSRILKSINNTWKEYQKNRSAKKRLFEDSENEPEITNASSVPHEIKDSKKTKLIEKSI